MHTCMKQVGKGTTSRCFVGNVEQARCRQVHEEYLASTRRFATHVLRKVTEGHVDWVGSFVSDERELSLVRTDDNGNNCGTRLLFLKLNLEVVTEYQYRDVVDCYTT